MHLQEQRTVQRTRFREQGSAWRLPKISLNLWEAPSKFPARSIREAYFGQNWNFAYRKVRRIRCFGSRPAYPAFFLWVTINRKAQMCRCSWTRWALRWISCLIRRARCLCYKGQKLPGKPISWHYWMSMYLLWTAFRL